MSSGNARQTLGFIDAIEGLTNKRCERVDPPFGGALDEFLLGELNGHHDFAFCDFEGD